MNESSSSSSSDKEEVVANNSESSEQTDHDDDNDNTITPSSALAYNYQYVPVPQSFTAEQLERISVIEAAASNVQRVLDKYGNASTLPSSLDPHDVVVSSGKHDGWKIDPKSPWADTPSAIHEIVAAGERMVRAWSSSSSSTNNEKTGDNAPTIEPRKEWWQSILSNDTPLTNSNESSSESICRNNGANDIPPMDEPFTEEEQLQFHNVYMEWATIAFQEELDALRKGQLLDAFTSTRRRTKNTTTTTSNTNIKSSSSSSSSSVDLDSTQYSFVVATNNNRDDNNREGIDGETDAAIEVEAARIASVKEMDVRVLSDMLYSGSNVLSQSEKRMLLHARQRAVLKDMVVMEVDESDATTTTGLTLHERRKREIGLC